ncbi:WhiB family transcriptional regulator [Streptomyces sp. NPDC055897]
MVIPADRWKTSALCAEIDPDLFFPERGASVTEAKQICFACEARIECLTYALNTRERFGIWGGMTERGRRRLLANIRQEEAA